MALADNLDHYWKFDETSDGSGAVTRNDSVGSWHLSDLSPYAASATGKVYSNGAVFVSANNEALFRDNESYGGDVDLEFECWVKLTSKSATQAIFVKGYNGVGDSFRLAYDSAQDRFVFSAYGGGSNHEIAANNFGSPSLSTWYHVRCYHDKTNNVIGISVNDGTANTVGHSTGFDSTTTTLSVGVYAGSGNWGDFTISGLAMWSRVLSSGERTWMYNSGSGRTYADITGASAVSVVQHDEGYYLVGSVTPMFDVAVTNGNAIAMLVCQYGGGGDVSVTEPLYNGTISLVAQSSDGKVKLFFKRNVTGGFTSVNLTFTDPSASYIMEWWELANVDASANVEYTTKDETAATSHDMGTSMTGSGFFVGGSRLGATATGTAGSGWTGHPPAAENAFLQYKIEDGVGETSPFTVNTSVTSTAMLALIPGTGASPSTPTIGLPFLASTFTVYPPSKVSHVSHFPYRPRLVRR